MIMASTSTAKSSDHHPLHNFHLPPLLNWTTNHHRTTHKNAADFPTTSSRRSPLVSSLFGSAPSYTTERMNPPLPVSVKNCFPSIELTRHSLMSPYNSEHHLPPPDKNESELKGLVAEVDRVSLSCGSDSLIGKSVGDGVQRGRGGSKLVIRLRRKEQQSLSSKNGGNQIVAAPSPKGGNTIVNVEKQSAAVKVWNLRPRCNKKLRIGTSTEENIAAQHSSLIINSRERSSRHRSTAEENNLSNRENPQFSISLTMEEVTADFVAMTESKPPGKPKKRPRSIQKELNILFPGYGLGIITPRLYRVKKRRQS
ncbi:hypothetical protein Ancab_040086 [Ancistrocladus abbreviatus]